MAADDRGKFAGGLFEFFVLEQLVDELPARVDVVVRVGVGIDGVEAFGQQEPALYLHQRGGHDKEFAGDVEVERLHRSKGFEVLLRDGLDRDVVDVDLDLADQKKQQVKRAFEDLKFDAVIGFGSHGAERFGRRWGAANKNARRS